MAVVAVAAVEVAAVAVAVAAMRVAVRVEVLVVAVEAVEVHVAVTGALGLEHFNQIRFHCSVLLVFTASEPGRTSYHPAPRGRLP